MLICWRSFSRGLRQWKSGQLLVFPDAVGSEEGWSVGADRNGERPEHSAIEEAGAPERPAVPTECEDLLKPAHLGDTGVRLDVPLQRKPDQGADEPVAGLAAVHRILVAAEA